MSGRRRQRRDCGGSWACAVDMATLVGKQGRRDHTASPHYWRRLGLKARRSVRRFVARLKPRALMRLSSCPPLFFNRKIAVWLVFQGKGKLP